MNQNDLRPAKQFAQQFGVKSVIYGGPGVSKTPTAANTSPRPVLLLSEPGALTLKHSDVPTFPAFTPAKLDEFFLWFFSSAESANFDTLIWDSASQGAEIILDELLSGKTSAGNDAHGKKAYGTMARKMMSYFTKLYFMPAKHVVLITKLDKSDDNGTIYKRPYFPGRELNVRVPHLFDLVMCLGRYNIPGVTPSPTTAFRCHESFDTMARFRAGNLAEYEPPNLANIFAKVMA